MMKTRREQDSLGYIDIPEDALYGPQTERARMNFPVSGQVFPRVFIRALACIKEANARAHAEEQPDTPEEAIFEAIARAAEETGRGTWDSAFPLDVYQTGSGTSTNMNMNEVLANRAKRILADAGNGSLVHPNDHVNRGQSSNDVFPSAAHLAAMFLWQEKLKPSLEKTLATLAGKSREFRDIVKIGRTHLQDATPITLGQEFSGYTAQIARALQQLETGSHALLELPLGGTAVGTGLNTSQKHLNLVYEHLRNRTGLKLREAANHFAAQSARDELVTFSGLLASLGVTLTKIANDIRWLSSGPRCGLGELRIPATQPGSSIMPGKVNPVQAESLLMVAARVQGNHSTVMIAGQSGNFELNVMMPVLIHSILESEELLASAITMFEEKCLAGLEAERERCAELAETSLAIVTALVPEIGYDKAAELAKEAYAGGKSIRDVLQKHSQYRHLIPKLDPGSMTGNRDLLDS